MDSLSPERSPGTKFLIAVVVGFLLSIPLFAVWVLVYDRQQQSETAEASIAQGWGGPQIMAGPLLVIPYRKTTSETVIENGREVTREREIWRQLTLSPEQADLSTEVRPERRARSIYEVVVYQAQVQGRARFTMPSDLDRLGIALRDLDLARAQLRFGLSDPRGLGANPGVSVGGASLRLNPGGGTEQSGGRGFFAWLDAGALASGPMLADFNYVFRGNGSLALAPQAGDTRWRLRSSWPHPSFQGGFLPASHRIGAEGFDAVYRVGNLALGEALASTGEVDQPAPDPNVTTQRIDVHGRDVPGDPHLAQVSLILPVDLYSQVDRSTKYGFLFIGFTFLAFLMFDLIGGVRVSAIEYLLVGSGLILFFVLLLAFAEVIGFAPAYVVASAAIAGLNTAYSAAVLKSWRRAGFIGALLVALYAVLYVLLSLEDYSLLIGSLMLFAALTAVMYLTRNLDWGGRGDGGGCCLGFSVIARSEATKQSSQAGPPPGLLRHARNDDLVSTPAQVAAIKVGDPGDAHQLHAADDLVPELAERAFDAGLAFGGERIEIEPAARTGLGADAQGLEHMAAAAHSAIEDDVEPVADRIDDVGEHVERRGAAVELAPAMVRHHHGGRADVERALRVGDRHQPLDRELAAPILADLLGRDPVHPVVEHVVDIVGDAGRDVRAGVDIAREIGKVEAFAAQIIERPARVGGEIPGEARRHLQGRGEARFEVALAVSPGGGIDGDRDRVEAGFLRALEQGAVEAGILVDVELEQLGGRDRCADFLDAHRADRRDAEPGAELLGRLGDGALALPVEEPLHRGRREHQRHRDLFAENGGAKIGLGDAGEHVGDEVAVVERLGVAAKRHLVVGAAVDIVEDRARQPFLREPPEVRDIVAVAKPHSPSAHRLTMSAVHVHHRRDGH